MHWLTGLFGFVTGMAVGYALRGAVAWCREYAVRRGRPVAGEIWQNRFTEEECRIVRIDTSYGAPVVEVERTREWQALQACAWWDRQNSTVRCAL